MTDRHRAKSFCEVTERLNLRSRTRDDTAWNLELLGEHDNGTTMTFDEICRRLPEQNESARVNGFGLLTIRCRVGSDPIGYCGLISGRNTFDEPELACELLRRFHGHGYATEAADAVAEAAFATGRCRLWATIRNWNAPSFRVPEKIGLQRDRMITDERGELVYMAREG